jgi:hypothetical protein
MMRARPRSNFDYTTRGNEDVGRFEVSVKNVARMKVQQAIDQRFEDSGWD